MEAVPGGGWIITALAGGFAAPLETLFREGGYARTLEGGRSLLWWCWRYRHLQGPDHLMIGDLTPFVGLLRKEHPVAEVLGVVEEVRSADVPLDFFQLWVCVLDEAQREAQQAQRSGDG